MARRRLHASQRAAPESVDLDEPAAGDLDLQFYDRFFRDRAYLPTHARHMARWHPHEDLPPALPRQR